MFQKIAKKITRERLEQFLTRHASSERTLDIGSGGSSYGRFFPNRISVDADAKRKPDIIADAHRLPFRDAEFPVILCTEVLEHLIDPRTAIAEMKRVLAPGGKVILTTRFAYPIHDAPGDYWRFTKYILRDLFREWENVAIEEETKNFSAIAVLLQRLSYQSELRGGKATKVALLLLAQIFSRLDWLMIRGYGDINRENREDIFLSSGYYLSARRPQGRSL